MFSKSSTPQLFDSIADKYDRINGILSLGMHHRWRRALTRYLPQLPSLTILDLMCGTGDIFYELLDCNAHVDCVVGVDASQEMLGIASRKKKCAKGFLINARAENLPFKESSFDAVTIGFGVRNVDDPIAVMRKAACLLKAGGRIVILEFSKPDNRFFRPFFSLYMRFIIVGLGSLLSGNKTAYEYLLSSVDSFPYGKDFLIMMESAGFKECKAQQMCLGAVTIYVGVVDKGEL